MHIMHIGCLSPDNLGGWYYHVSHFTDEDTEVYSGEVTSLDYQEVQLGFQHNFI